MLPGHCERAKGRANARLRLQPGTPANHGRALSAGWGRNHAAPDNESIPRMPDIQPAKHLLRHLDPDNHALNAIYITEDLMLSEQYKTDRYSFVNRLGGTLKMYELIQEMSNAVSQFECSYEHSPWSDLIDADWESICSIYTSRVLTHVLEHEEWPDLHAMLKAVALPSKKEKRHG
jgi:hypothetical protein